MARIVALLMAIAVFGIEGFALHACSERTQLALEAGIGPAPQLPPHRPSLHPTVHVAPAIGWPASQMLSSAPGLAVTAFAIGLEPPRKILLLPNGDVLVAERNVAHRPDAGPDGPRGGGRAERQPQHLLCHADGVSVAPR